LAGGIAGWMAYTILKANEGRGLAASVVIGMVAGYLGGRGLAPMFAASAIEGSDFSPFALFIASATAVACLTVTSAIHKRYGI
jgi:uncharacterized membrane protein YeaQ/YmgE (transglycosylase-associated protein family)